MAEFIISGYISVRSALEAKKRQVFKLIYDRARYDNVMNSKYHDAEKRQYVALAKYGVQIEFLTAEEFSALCPGQTSGGISAVVGEREYLQLDELLKPTRQFIAVLDGLEDPYNFGYALRTLYAAGVNGLILPQRNFFDSTEIVCRASAGASELLDICVVSDTAEAALKIKSAGYMIASTAKSEKAVDLYRARIRTPLCVVFGGEKRGIGSEILDLSDIVIKIRYPRQCPFSLSALSAVSIISFEISRKLAFLR